MEKTKDFSSYYANHGAMVTGMSYFTKNEDNDQIMATGGKTKEGVGEIIMKLFG